MSAETLAQKIARRDAYLVAETAVLTGAQSYNAFGKSLTRADLSEIRAAITQLNREISAEEAKASGSGGGAFNKITFGRPI